MANHIFNNHIRSSQIFIYLFLTGNVVLLGGPAMKSLVTTDLEKRVLDLAQGMSASYGGILLHKL